MNKTVKCALLSGILGQFLSFLTVFILTVVTLLQDDPAPSAKICGYIAIIVGAAIIGVISAVKCRDNLITPFLGSAFYIVIRLIFCAVFSVFTYGGTTIESQSFVQKILIYALIIFIPFFVFLIFHSKKSKKRSASSIRNSMAKNYKHLHRI